MPDRINSANIVTVGGQRMFQNKNLAAGIAGTTWDAIYENGIQESVIRTIELSGQTPDPANLSQFVEAAQRVAAAHVTTVTATATLTLSNAGTVLVSATAGSIVITLPPAGAAAGLPALFRFVRSDFTANTVSIALQGSDNWSLGGANPIPLGVTAPLQIAGDGNSHWSLIGGQAPYLASFTYSQTFYGRPDITFYEAEVWGGGGGGGSAAVSNTSVGGGGGGYSSGQFVLAPTASVFLTVGAGGPGGTSAGVWGYNGGLSSVGSYLTALGGIGGQSNGPSGGGGGTASGGVLNFSGGQGQISYPGATNPVGGSGGASFKGAPAEQTSGSAGFAATFPGVGGGAGVNGNSGGAGANGLIIIRGIR